MSKIKVDDKVRFVSVPYGDSQGRVGDIVTVHNYSSVDVMYADGDIGYGYDINRFELANKYPNPPHKHAELIKAWLEQALKKIAELKRQLEIAEYRLNRILNEEDDGEEL